MEGGLFYYISILYKNDFHGQTFILKISTKYVPIWALVPLAMNNNNYLSIGLTVAFNSVNTYPTLTKADLNLQDQVFI